MNTDVTQFSMNCVAAGILPAVEPGRLARRMEAEMFPRALHDPSQSRAAGCRPSTAGRMPAATTGPKVFGLAVVLTGLTCLALVSQSFGQETNSGTTQSRPAAGKTLIDYFLPMPIQGSLTMNAWGATNVLPRDAQNGLEDTTAKQWSYWDGQIIKGPDGKYHMFASRWDQAKGHGGWGGSLAVHAVSDNIIGPYVDKGLCWPENQGGKGHNVTALVLPDGRYAVVVSETRPGDVFVSKSLDGPWEQLGSIKVATNEFSRLGRMSNVSIMVRPDGDFMIVARSGAIWISKDGILGPYTVQGPSVYSTIPELRPMRTLEDPVVWYSGGLYHIVVNDWRPSKAYHITSVDGIKDWKFQGLAYDPTTDFLRYTDGTVNHWNKIERPGVLVENGRVTHFTLAVLDVPKNQERGDDNHSSKIIVVPFDGAALDRDLQNASPITVPAAVPANPPCAATINRRSHEAFSKHRSSRRESAPLFGNSDRTHVRCCSLERGSHKEQIPIMT